jgi:sigma-B regulation protein RsbU (phosphoserine phosphatase)
VSAVHRTAAHVLVVDDGATNRHLLGRILAGDGLRTSFAADGETALAAAQSEPPDLVLLDVLMPGLDGFEVCRRLKAQPQTADVPVIFLTSLERPEDKVRGLQLGAVDWVAKPFDPAEVRARVANQVRLRQLQRSLQRANAELQQRQALLDDDLRAAAAIQHSLLPRVAPACPAFELAWRFVPCESVGGDIFHVVPLGAERYALWVLDVCGHGVPAAMVTVSVAQSLAAQAGLLCGHDGEPVSPATVLRRLDREYPFERFERHATVACVLLDAATGRLTSSVAAAPAPLLVRTDGVVERLDAGGTVIGLGSVLPFAEQSVSLRAGDRLVLVTDGVLECESPDGQPFGEERLARFLADRRREPLQAACDALLAELRAFAGGRPARDDVTLLALDFLGPLRAAPSPAAPHEASP